MKRHEHIFFQIIFCLIAFAIVQSCAVEAAPLGGPVDKTPPFPDPVKSTKNEQIFFVKQDIKLVFDEWVKLKNQSQIIISPPLDKGIEAKLKGKSVILSFDEDEVLKENTTYTINLGQSIVDYTEGNPMENYTFVFSTGAYIDSLFVRGSVIDAFTGEPKENIIVSLYDDLRDSSIYNSQPLYFTRTNKEGEFEIRNIKKDSFTVFALDDKNLNYYKDQESEGMGFYGDTIELDTAFITPLKLQFFNPDPSLRMTNKMHSYGFLKLVFNRDPFDVNFTYSREPEYFQTLAVKDSMYVWYQNVDSTELYVNLNSDKTDTVNLIVYNDTLKYSKKLKIQKINASNRVALPPLDTLLITFNHPVVDADVSKIILKDTSPINLKLSIQLDSLAKNNLKLIHKWKEGQKYELHFLDSAFMDHLGNTSDTINLQFVTGNNSSLGEIIFELDSLNKSYNYIVELVKGNEILKKYVKNSTQAKIVFSSLSSGNYTTRIYEDRNKNDRWDPGNYNLKQQSEKWISKKLESLKAGWTLEVSVNGKEFK